MDALNWLLECGQPSVRYLALRDVLRLPAADPLLQAARAAAYARGQLRAVLNAMHADGWWGAPGPGYLPKYTSTVWALILLAQLGAHVEDDARIERACDSFLDQALAPGGQISTNGAPSGTADCLQGNLCWALTVLGCKDPRLPLAYDWLARSVTGEGISPMTEKAAPVRYYAGKCGPNFACGSNNKQPCAWGAVKVLLALAAIPAGMRSASVERAQAQAVDFIFSVDPATAAYPSGWTDKPSGSWFKFGFPVFYVTDVLQVVEALSAAGFANDPRLANALAFIRSKASADGRWALEYDYSGKTLADFGEKKQPSPWVTLRALRVLSAGDRPTADLN